jgi:PTH1 family peptidyl-tRNA hydrolase
MFPFIKKLFGERKYVLKTKDPMKKFLLLGLGNIGEDYVGTRHNIGFQAMDTLAQQEGFSFESRKLGDVGSFKVKGRHVLVLKPSTFMNRSGKALKYWLEKENIPLEHLLVVTDDLNLPFGTLRLKSKGSDGGHNGLQDIQQYLGRTDYHRLRFGVGAEFRKGQQVDFVLGKWNEEEKKSLGERLERLSQMICSFVLAGPKITMNEYHGT